MIIKLINSLGEVINNDPKTRELIKVAFLPDYRVSLAEKIIPAATYPNRFPPRPRSVGHRQHEIRYERRADSGDSRRRQYRDSGSRRAENIFIFGLTAEQIEELTLKETYRPRDYYESDPRLSACSMSWRQTASVPASLDCSDGFAILVSRDDYFLMADFGSYVDIQSVVLNEYQHPEVWTRKAILNLARIGYSQAIVPSQNTPARYGTSARHELAIHASAMSVKPCFALHR